MNARRTIAGSALALLMLTAQMTTAQGAAPATNAPAREGHRFLIVIDTSRSMKSRLTPTLALVEHLISSGMDGRLRHGDTIGVWTFGSGLQTGDFPLQTWTPERRRQIGLATVRYIENLRFRGSTDLQEPLSAALELARESDEITILFLTDGETPFRGTPFDVEINAALRSEVRPMRSSSLPFAVFLVGHRGRLTAYAVNSSLKSLVYPEVPASLREAPPKPTAVVEKSPGVLTPSPAETNAKSRSPEPGSNATVNAASPHTLPARNESPSAATRPPAAPASVIAPGGAPRTTEKGSVILPQPMITSSGSAGPSLAATATRPATNRATSVAAIPPDGGLRPTEKGSVILPQPVITSGANAGESLAPSAARPGTNRAASVPVIPPGGEPRTTEKGSVILPQPVITTGQSLAATEAKSDTNQSTPLHAEASPVQKPSLTESKPALIEHGTLLTAAVPTTNPVVNMPTLADKPVIKSSPPVTAMAGQPATTAVTNASPIVPGRESQEPTNVAVALASTNSDPVTVVTARGPVSNALPGIVAAPSTNAGNAPTQAVVSPTRPVAAVPPVTTSTSVTRAGATAAPANAPAPPLAAIPPEAGYSPRTLTLLIAAFAMLAVAAVMLRLMAKRRATVGASIITRSMEHGRY